MTRITLASIQPPCLDPVAGADGEVVERGFSWLEEALGCGADIACLPEFFNVFGAPDEERLEAAANWREVLNRAADAAARHRAHVILPLLAPSGDSFVDRAYVIDDRGVAIGHYDKIHPTVGEREELKVRAGEDLPVWRTDKGSIAVVICYDLYFPELFARLAALGPDMIFVPSLQRSEHELASEAIVKVRAMDTQAYVVRSSYGAAASTPWRAGMMFGQSCIVHPDGTILGNAGHYEGFALARVTVPFVWQRQRCGGYPTESVRSFLRDDRRPDAYRQDD